MLASSVVLLNDNMHPHYSCSHSSTAEHFHWELFNHPPYNPDLAPSDYHLLTHLMNWLRSQRFSNNEELLEGVKM
jgi:hypothetical protein